MTDMKIKLNVTEQLFDYLASKPFTERDVKIVDGKNELVDEPLTYRKVAQRVLFNGLRGEEDMTGNQKATLFALAVKLSIGDEVEVTVDEAKLIKERVRKAATPMISGQMDAFIDKALA